MNTNHYPSEHAPRHRAEQDEDPEHGMGDAFVRQLADQAPSVEAAERLTDLYQRHGTAFAVYLGLDDVDPYAETTEEDFTEVYYDCFTTREGLIDDTIASFDWGRDLDRLLAGDPLLRAVVAFDRDAIWGFITDHYDIVAIGDSIYAFAR